MDMHGAAHVVGVMLGLGIGSLWGWNAGDAAGYQRAIRARLARGAFRGTQVDMERLTLIAGKGPLASWLRGWMR